MDGKLVRQLTDNPRLDDISPMFDRAGKSVLFFRQAITPDLKAKEGGYVLDLNTNKLVKLSSEEAKLQEKHREPTLHAIDISWSMGLDKMFQTDIAEGENAMSCQSPDGNYKLVSKPNPAFSESDLGNKNNGPPFMFFLRTKGSSETLPLDSLPGYPPYSDLDYLTFKDNPFPVLKGNPFVITPGFSALFMKRDRRPYSLWMLELKTNQWTEISERSGTLYVVPGRTGVTLLHGPDYDPDANFGLNLDCCYLEFWDATFHPIRLGPTTSCFHGAAIYYGSGHTLILRDPGYGS
jgi:hypothetical protein